MSTAHTPGPWGIWIVPIRNGVEHYIQSRTQVAVVTGSTNGMLGSDIPSDEEALANARLITAAPRMSDALKRAAHLLAELPEQSPQMMALRAEIVGCIKQATPEYYATGEES